MRRANWILGGVVLLTLLSILYLFSLGPAFHLLTRGWISTSTFNAYASPMYLLTGESQCRTAMMDYIARWHAERPDFPQVDYYP